MSDTSQGHLQRNAKMERETEDVWEGQDTQSQGKKLGSAPAQCGDQLLVGSQPRVCWFNGASGRSPASLQTARRTTIL